MRITKESSHHVSDDGDNNTKQEEEGSDSNVLPSILERFEPAILAEKNANSKLLLEVREENPVI